MNGAHAYDNRRRALVGSRVGVCGRAVAVDAVWRDEAGEGGEEPWRSAGRRRQLEQQRARTAANVDEHARDTLRRLTVDRASRRLALSQTIWPPE